MPTLKKREDWNDACWRDVDDQLVLPHGELLDVFGEAAHEPGAVAMHVLSFGSMFIGGIDQGRAKAFWRVGGSLSMAHVGCISRYNDLGRPGRGEGTGEGLIATSEGSPA